MRKSGWLSWVPLFILAAMALLLVACGGDEEEVATASPTAAATQVATSAPTAAAPATAAPTTAAPTTAPATAAPAQARRLDVGSATITLDGQMDDWASVPGLEVPLTGIPEEFREDPTAAEDVTATLKVAADGTNVYVLVAVPAAFNYVADNHDMSAALAVMWQIDGAATPQMAAGGADLKESTGTVDIWHWELDCGPGELSGGVFPTGNDPDCNLDDEYATLLDEREDDAADSSLTGAWDHSARAQGAGADGTWVFEIARPLDTGDPHDAQFAAGGTALIAVAYWAADETPEGWTASGHAVSVAADEGLDGWIEVAFAN